MPHTQRMGIVEGIKSLNSQQDAGGSGWTTFESLGEEHWIQYGAGTLNMDWPFHGEPDDVFAVAYLQPLGNPKRVSWDRDVFATFDVGRSDPETAAAVIDDLFCRLYGLGPDYRLQWKVEQG